jgi:2-polyprenyl-3-methyl-5-hydroxy-6-metoxy-1,4-benzoquinol methylase
MNTHSAPSPALLFDTVNAYHKTAAIKAAIDLDLFTAIGSTPATAAELAAKCQGTPRGIRILADFLTIIGFLTKEGDRYALTLDSATFLDRNSPAYSGGITEFLLAPQLTEMFSDLAKTIRSGKPAESLGTIAAEHPVWMRFARSMGPMMFPAAHGVAELVQLPADRPIKVLDISASHGQYGLAFASKYPQAHVVGADWPSVLQVARENAKAMGVESRYSTIEGDAFTVDLGRDYDVVLVPNFLHHFPAQECVRFLQRVHATLRPGGHVAIVEFVPNPDRVSPPPAAMFSLIMLGSTPEGDAYTFAELENMLTQAGFKAASQHPLLPTAATAVIASK